MKISVVMTVCNGERYLAEQLNSIVNQTVKPDEIIVADDCSTDESCSIVDSFVSNYPEIEWVTYTNSERLGWQRNFMEAFRKASGDIIFCSDQDDVWELKKIELMASVFEIHTDIDLLGCDYSVISADGSPQGDRRVLYPETAGHATEAGIEVKLEKVEFSPIFYEAVRPGCALAFRNSYLEEISNYWVPGYPHDELLWNMAILKGTAYVFHERLLNYRMHDTNTTKTRNTRAERIDLFEFQGNACRQCLTYANDIGLSAEKKRVIKKAISFFELRQHTYEKKKVSGLIKLNRFLDYYTYKPAYLKDWQYCFKK